MDILAQPEELSAEEDVAGRPAQELWAKLDHLETSVRGGRVGVLDSIDAGWFDARRGPADSTAPRGWLTSDLDSGEHVSILVVADSNVSQDQRWYRAVLGRGEIRSQTSASEADLHEQPAAALQYDAVLGLPTLRPLISFRPATRQEAAALGAAGSMSGSPDAQPDEVIKNLGAAENPQSAAVFDVGQGNWNALLSDGAATLLFDIGGGVLAHLRTFPSGFTNFCFAEEPTVVLSHWDWDHWSSALRFPAAQGLTWIVPRQGALGPTHARFLAALRSHGTVLIHPTGGFIASPSIELQQGHGKGRNETGLALLVRNQSKSMLFPADAGYETLRLPDTLTSVVVPHHGGRARSVRAAPPASDGDAVGRAVFSFGAGNYFGHPHPSTCASHAAWAGRMLLTANRGSKNQPGHIELHWTVPTAATAPCCVDSALPLPQR